MIAVLALLVQGIDWKTDWESALQEAGARNVPILFTVQKEGYTQMVDGPFADAGVVANSRTFVNVVAMEPSKHGEADGRCKLYRNIPCASHEKIFKHATKFWKSPIQCPALAFLDPAGTLLFKADGLLTTPDLLKKMQSALSKISGEKIPLPQWQKAHQLLADGQTALDKGEVKKALEAFRKVAAMKGKSLQTMAADAIDRVAGIGETRLSEALALADAKDKKRALAKIADEFKGLDVATRAKKEFDAVK
jgi:hypothetical protein